MGLNINMYAIKREERYAYYSELINLFNPIYMPLSLEFKHVNISN